MNRTGAYLACRDAMPDVLHPGLYGYLEAWLHYTASMYQFTYYAALVQSETINWTLCLQVLTGE